MNHSDSSQEVVSSGQSASELVAAFRLRQAKFEQELWAHWQSAFYLYGQVLMAARHAAAYFMSHYRANAVEDRDALYEVLTRLHARGYRTAWEIRALLLSGNPAGALARWRTLYEVLVTMQFVEKHGAETADRYLKNDAIQTAKNLGQYADHYEKLGQRSISRERVDEARKERAELKQEWAVEADYDYAWAALALGRTNPKSTVNFADLEQDVDLGHVRLYYSIASNHVHSNVKGLDEDPWADMLPTMKGLSLAGYEGMARLADATAIMLNLRPTTDTERLKHDLTQVVEAGATRFQELEGDLDTQTQPD